MKIMNVLEVLDVMQYGYRLAEKGNRPGQGKGIDLICTSTMSALVNGKTRRAEVISKLIVSYLCVINEIRGAEKL